jgi:tryptophanyl-tRNA synthetase
MLARSLNAHLGPFRARRAEIAQNPSAVWDVLHDGAGRARAIAEGVMGEVRQAIGLPE